MAFHRWRFVLLEIVFRKWYLLAFSQILLEIRLQCVINIHFYYTETLYLDYLLDFHINCHNLYQLYVTLHAN